MDQRLCGVLNRRSGYRLLWIVFMLALSACSGSPAPRQIAAFPAQSSSGGTPFAPHARDYRVTDAYLEIEVSDLHEAAAEAARVAGSYGGSLLSWQSWQESRYRKVWLELEIPAVSYPAVRGALLNLGQVIREREVGLREASGYPPAIRDRYTRISLSLRARDSMIPAPTWSGWNPALTFRQAMRVFARIFGLLADTIIWIVVVGGPFALMGWGAYALVRRLWNR